MTLSSPTNAEERDSTVEPAILIVNLAYATLAMAGMCKQVRTLRLVMLTSGLLFATFGLVAGIPSMVIWNVGLGALNTRRLWCDGRGTNVESDLRAAA